MIFIVDDNRDDRELYADYFKFCGFRVATAADGAAACQRASGLEPDVIVMDLSLPYVDGWEATRRLKSHQATAHIPIVACTGHAFGPSVEKALAAGCDAYVVKPCQPRELLDVVRHLLSRPRVRSA